MTFGEKISRAVGTLVSTLCVCALAIVPLAFSHAGSSTGVELTELMQKLSAVRAAGGKFTECKYLSILNEPLILEGTVHYRAPDYLKKEYDDPDSESYEVRGDNLTIEFPDGRRRDLSIDEHPVLRAFVESYRGTLAGDLETLRRHFELELGGHMDAWQLRLTPRTRELVERLRAVVMRGREGTVTSVETLEASGDRSVMTLESSGE
jgi:outer membrane lipoprotein-sorting protein